MTLFELVFGLSSIILSLALAHIASNLYRLAAAGRRVRWAPEPVLQTAIVLLVIIFVWMNQWEARNATELVYWQALLQVLKLMVLYIAAAACLPEVGEGKGEFDLYRHYDDNRRLSFGALSAGLVLFFLYRAASDPGFRWNWGMLGIFLYLGPYIAMMFVRIRWLNTLALAALLIAYANTIMEYRLDG